MLLGMGNRIFELRAAAGIWWPFRLLCVRNAEAVAVSKKQHGHASCQDFYKESPTVRPRIMQSHRE